MLFVVFGIWVLSRLKMLLFITIRRNKSRKSSLLLFDPESLTALKDTGISVEI
jgi:hypothetical protein